MRINRVGWTVTSLFLTLVLGGMVTAQMGPGGPPEGWRGGPGFGRPDRGPRGEAFGERALDVLAEHLALTEDQEDRIRTILEEQRSSVGQKSDEIVGLEEALRDRLEAASPDPAEVGNLVISLHSLRNQIRDSWVAAGESVKAVLTPEQVAKLESLVGTRDQARLSRAARALGLIPPPEPGEGRARAKARPRP